MVSELWDESLDGVSTLLVSDEVAERRHDDLQDFEPLLNVTYCEEFLHHVISILMHNELN